MYWRRSRWQVVFLPTTHLYPIHLLFLAFHSFFHTFPLKQYWSRGRGELFPILRPAGRAADSLRLLHSSYRHFSDNCRQRRPSSGRSTSVQYVAEEFENETRLFIRSSFHILCFINDNDNSGNNKFFVSLFFIRQKPLLHRNVD